MPFSLIVLLELLCLRDVCVQISPRKPLTSDLVTKSSGRNNNSPARTHSHCERWLACYSYLDTHTQQLSRKYKTLSVRRAPQLAAESQLLNCDETRVRLGK
jgi:hypothetical protein